MYTVGYAQIIAKHWGIIGFFWENVKRESSIQNTAIMIMLCGSIKVDSFEF